MDDQKRYLKMVEKERRSIEQLFKQNQIEYKDCMFKFQHFMKTVSQELEMISQCHEKDFESLSKDINNAKEPIKRVIERATIESESVLKELERTQKNNRTLIDDYLKNVRDNANTKSQINLF